MNHKIYTDLSAQSEKRKKFSIRITTFLKGEVKNSFMDDLSRRKITESDLAKSIIEIYYSAIKQKPELELLNTNEIKKYIIDKVRF